MKRSRLLTLLLLLQTRQRMTTGELADRLEVSRRTVLRDVEALSSAGIPVYAERGRHGGIVLLPGARLDASHLDPAELDALSLTGLDPPRLRQLGLAEAAEQAADKVAARRARRPDGVAVPLSELVVTDNASWLAGTAEVDVADLAVSLRGRVRWQVSYRHSGSYRPEHLVVDPYGLAVKAGRWYLVVDVDGVPRLLTVERLVSFSPVPEPARFRSGATLTSVWADLRERVERGGDVVVEARLRRDRLDLARRILGTRISAVEDLDDEWCRLMVRYDQVEAVRQLLQFGDHIEVRSPAAARARVEELALDLAARHAPSGG